MQSIKKQLIFTWLTKHRSTHNQKRILTMIWETSQVKGGDTWIIIFTIVWQLLNKTIVALNCNIFLEEYDPSCKRTRTNQV